MSQTHKNKTFTTLLAFLLGGVGAHRFYLRGAGDKWAWLHVASVPACAAVALAAPQADRFYQLLPLIVSVLLGCLQALVLGLMSDEKWDAAYNGGSGRQSDSTWPLALILVLTLAIGVGGTIAAMARLFDLMYTGGAYG
ncbi:NINE protein [Rugamonas sp.]|uniref:NINE protein n=1 Tax=Rugamonas sp. TaxID=1926287 RepID=UPI0025F6E481|nr:NINE protein [Rugamonas sp.]